MLHHIEFKLQIEKQYKQGIDKMAALYQAEGDRKSRTDAESKRVESQSKIMLLQQALKRYKQLHVMDDEADNDGRECRREAAMTIEVIRLTPLTLLRPLTYVQRALLLKADDRI